MSTRRGSLADAVGLRRSAVGLSQFVAATLALAPAVRKEAALLVVLSLYAVGHSGLTAPQPGRAGLLEPPA